LQQNSKKVLLIQVVVVVVVVVFVIHRGRFVPGQRSGFEISVRPALVGNDRPASVENRAAI
jgi:cell shape-determining protein MreC